MPKPSVTVPHSSHSSACARRFTKTAVTLWALAGLTGGAALHAAAGQLQGLVFDYAWRTAAAQTEGRGTFGGDATSGPELRSMTVLRGVNGEVFTSPGIQAAADRAASEAAGTGALANVSPAAWNRLSAGDCITVTTKGGQTLSFSIIGAHPASGPKAETLPKIDLAVTACSGTGEPIAKAVIEPARVPAVQHNL